jgi:hypothetical protein
MISQTAETRIEQWPVEKLVFYARNPRKNDAAVDRMCGSIREFGFKIPVLARSDGEVVDGHLRLKAARKLGITDVPVILCDEWTPAQVKAFRLMVNRSVTWADWDEELLKDSTTCPAFFIAPAMNPRTVCFCQPICDMIPSRVTPFGRCSRAITVAVLLPSRTPLAFGSAAFLGVFGAFFCRAGFGASGATVAPSGTSAPASATGSAGAGSLLDGGSGNSAIAGPSIRSLP